MKSLRPILRRIGLAGPTFDMRAFVIPRRWSNAELRKFSHLFGGDVVNVSAWEDRDKEGGFYREYFPSADAYSITNFGTDQGALQNRPDEMYLDLEDDLDPSLARKFTTVFNHTTLEHVWDFRKAFSNICDMSSDTVIIVLPWLQPMHANYGDYWRFSPQATVRMFEEKGFRTLYISWNNDAKASVYIFAIASRSASRWSEHFPDTPLRPDDEKFVELPANNPGAAAFG